jgi:hypothetical protein
MFYLTFALEKWHVT